MVAENGDLKWLERLLYGNILERFPKEKIINMDETFRRDLCQMIGSSNMNIHDGNIVMSKVELEEIID